MLGYFYSNGKTDNCVNLNALSFFPLHALLRSRIATRCEHVLKQTKKKAYVTSIFPTNYGDYFIVLH